MKQLNFFALFYIVSLTATAQVPRFINYQAIARHNISNTPIPHERVSVHFTIREGNSTGISVFEEDQDIATDDCGLFNLKIGYANPLAFSQINWSTGSKFLEVTINGLVSGVSELSTTPYSFYADYAKSSLDWKNVGDTVLFSTGKKIGIGTASPQAPLDIAGYARITGTGGSSTKIRLDAQAGNTDNWITSFDEDGNRLWILNLADRSSGDRFGLYSQRAGSHVFNITTDGNVGIKKNASSAYSLAVKGDVDVDGEAFVKCLTIKGGCDWYEEAQAKETILPGFVVVIDTDAAVNSVKLSSQAYDPLVTGVVSGAGGINPGMGLTQDGVLDGNIKIAMGGKVKVYVTGTVKPGDLLTSSDKAGYAMAVKDRDKSFGAVIGKALSKIDSEGLVLMQVMLH